MAYELRIVVEKVSQKTGEVVNREVAKVVEIKPPASIFDLGLGHGEQIGLLQKVQDTLLEEQSLYLRENSHHCPQCKSKLVKHGYKASNFHGVFTDHKVKVQRLKCVNVACSWRSVPSVDSLLGTSIHPDLAKLQSEIGALHTFRESQKILAVFSTSPRPINNHDRVKHTSESIGEEVEKIFRAQVETPLGEETTKALTVQVDGGHIKSTAGEKRSFEALSALVYNPQNIVIINGKKAQIKEKHCVASAKSDHLANMKHLTLKAAQKEGLTAETTVTALCDGASNCWRVIESLKPYCGAMVKILDWFHIGVKFEHLLNVIPEEQKEEIEKIKWKLWHGKSEEVFTRLNSLKSNFSPSPVGKKIHLIYTYLKRNLAYLVNYAKRYKEGQVISSQAIESTIGQLINSRCKKKQKMRWSREGAHALLQIRAAMWSGEWQEVWREATIKAFHLPA